MVTEVRTILQPHVDEHGIVPYGQLVEGNWFVTTGLTPGVVGVIVDGRPFYPFYNEGPYRSITTPPSDSPVKLLKKVIIKESCR